MAIKRFEDLEVWKLSLRLTRDIYDLASQPKFNKDYGLRDQIQRAVISVSSNIVEGFDKRNNNEFIRFLKISSGSLGEVKNQLYIALTIQYITQRQFDGALVKVEELSAKIGGLVSYLLKVRNRRINS